LEYVARKLVLLKSPRRTNGEDVELLCFRMT